MQFLPEIIPILRPTESTVQLINPFQDELVNGSRLYSEQVRREEAGIPTSELIIISPSSATPAHPSHVIPTVDGQFIRYLSATTGPPSYIGVERLHDELTNEVELSYLAYLPHRQLFLAVTYTKYAIGPWFYGHNGARMGNFRVDGFYQDREGIAILMCSSCNIDGEPTTTTHPRLLAVPYQFLSKRYQRMMEGRMVDVNIWQQVPSHALTTIDTQAETGKGTWWSAATPELIRMHEN